MKLAKQIGLLVAIGGLGGLLVSAPNLVAKSKNRMDIPNGKSYSCRACHGRGSYKGGKNLNSFGKDYRDNDHVWDSILANMDSDKDGKTNGWELGDEEGAWKKGDENPNPGRKIYNPGKKDSF